MNILKFLGWVAVAIFIAGGLGFILTSIFELKKRTSFLAAGIILPMAGFFVMILLWNSSTADYIVGIILALSLITGIIMLLPLGVNIPLYIPGPQVRVDEREAIFHRFLRLKPGMKDFKQFYHDNPHLEEIDTIIRTLPNLDEPGSQTYNRLTTPYNSAIFDVMDSLFRSVEQAEEVANIPQVNKTAAEFTQRIKGFSLYLGADLVGITPLNPAYVYSHVGRSPGKWGSEVHCDFPHAIVIAVEMKYEMVRQAPHHIATTESANRYYKAGQAALAVSRYIQLLGYGSRAHIDGNYKVLCGPIAVDAGLGELGRLGLLITPEFGPRVRLAVITTDLPLEFDKPINFGVQDFCDFCKKCADNCPSGSIEKNDKKLIKGVEKWQSNQEACFKYWRRVGSDCSICLKVCPYSHPGTLMHNIMRFFINRNGLARRLALLMDDFFYGRRPKTKFPFPDWHRS